MRHAPRTVGDERSFGVVERVSGRRFHQNLAYEDAVQSVCVFERGGRKITVELVEVVTRVVLIVLNRQNEVRF